MSEGGNDPWHPYYNPTCGPCSVGAERNLPGAPTPPAFPANCHTVTSAGGQAATPGPPFGAPGPGAPLGATQGGGPTTATPFGFPSGQSSNGQQQYNGPSAGNYGGGFQGFNGGGSIGFQGGYPQGPQGQSSAAGAPFARKLFEEKVHSRRSSNTPGPWARAVGHISGRRSARTTSLASCRSWMSCCHGASSKCAGGSLPPRWPRGSCPVDK